LGDYFTINDIGNAKGKRVLLRIDINSPIKDGVPFDDARFRGHFEILRFLEDSSVVLLAHQGRVGKKDYTTLEAHARFLSKLLSRDVKFIDDFFGLNARSAIKEMKPSEILMLENTRFYSEETLNRKPVDHAKSHIVQKLYRLFDIFVNDAFAVSHRSHLSVVGFTPVLNSYAGPLMDKEISNLKNALEIEDCSKVFVVGGCKINDSIKVIKNMLNSKCANKILIVGDVSIPFLKARGINIKSSLVRSKTEDQTSVFLKSTLNKYRNIIELPRDFIVKEKNGSISEVNRDDLSNNHYILDIGPETIDRYQQLIREASVAIINGEAHFYGNRSVWEDPVSNSTTCLLRAVSDADMSIACSGGSRTSGVIDRLGLKPQFEHISTGGIASLAFLSGRTLPGLEALEDARRRIGD